MPQSQRLCGTVYRHLRNKGRSMGMGDFVFYKNYNLPTLKEVEQHINEKGHLQNIPSAAEVEKSGINLVGR